MYRFASLVLLVMITVPAIFFIQLPKHRISESEKRALQQAPGFPVTYAELDSFPGRVDAYVNDHFPSRIQLVSIAERVKYHFGLHQRSEEKIIVLRPKKQTPAPKPNIDSVATADKDTFVYPDDGEEVEHFYSAGILIHNGAVFTLNSGSPKMSPYFSRMLNDYANKLQGRTKVYSCVAPLSSAFIPSSKYQKYYTRNESTLNAIRDNLDPQVGFCDVLGEMNRHRDKQLFFGTDHHWTAYGAYYAYQSFCKAAGLTPVPLEAMTRKVRYPVWGSLYELTRDQAVKDHPDSLVYFMPRVATSAVKYNAYNYDRPTKTSVFCECNNYILFLCGDAPLIRITTGVKNGRKAVVIKNSMGNAFAVYLVNHYEEIWVQDFRYSKHNLTELIQKQNINDLIFGLGMYGAMTHGTIGMMRNLATIKGGSPPPAAPKIQPADTIKAEATATKDTLSPSAN